MKLAKTITGFNPELVGAFVKIVGIDAEGEPVDIRGFVKQVSNDKIAVHSVYTGYESSRVSLYEQDFYFEDFFQKTEEQDQAFYEMYIYAEAIPVELEGGEG